MGWRSLAVSVAVPTVNTTVAVSWPLLVTAAVMVGAGEGRLVPVSATVGVPAPFNPGMTRVTLSAWARDAAAVMKLKVKALAQPVTAVP